MYARLFKRPLDFTAALLLLLVLWPLLAVVAVWLHFANHGAGAFFLQERPGLHGRIFRIVKFKTMTDARDAAGRLLPPAERLTRTGRLVRATSLDELPQLWNVLRGDMSLIGPRPLLPQYLPLYSSEQARRHDVRPGITGWAQCHGRNALSWQEKFRLDVWYVDHLTLRTDLHVLCRTLAKVVRHEGISPAGAAVMQPFLGNTPA